MHVCLLTDGNVPTNDRIRRHAEALDRAGHAVTVCARGTGGESDHELHDGIDIERIPDESLYAGVRGALDGIRYALQFVHPAWLRAANERHDEQAIDVCCVMDLSLLKTGSTLGGDLDIPVMCDLPNATAAIEGEFHDSRFRRTASRIFQSSWRRGRLVTKALPDADRLVTTCEEARAEYVRKKGIDPARVRVVRNTVAPTDIADHEPMGPDFDPDEAFVVTAFVPETRTENLETLVDAAARAANDAVSLQLVVVGDLGQETLDTLETRARRRLAGGRITFLTETAHRTDFLATSDVCIVPPREAETAIPTIVFEALAAGTPVVAADTPPVRRIVDGANAGRVVPFRPQALADALVTLSDPELASELGANGRRVAETECHPDRDAARLTEIYESVVAESRTNGPASKFVSAIRYEPTS